MGRETTKKAIKSLLTVPARLVLEPVAEKMKGKRAFQLLWVRMHQQSVSGMNIGHGGVVSESGELWVLRHVERYSAKNAAVVVFDVGANVGDYASQALGILGERLHLHCFEPSRKTFQSLASTMSSIGYIGNNVKLYNFGFGDREGTTTLYSDVEGSGLASVYRRRLDHFGVTMDCEETVRISMLDSFCAEEGIERIDFLKLDVEGHELMVLKGASNLLRSNSISFIQFEFGGCNIDSRTYFQDFFYLLNPYYVIHRVLTDGIIAIPHYRETLEIFTTTNYLAVSRAMPTMINTTSG